MSHGRSRGGNKGGKSPTKPRKKPEPENKHIPVPFKLVIWGLLIIAVLAVIGIVVLGVYHGHNVPESAIHALHLVIASTVSGLVGLLIGKAWTGE
jgi:hypothetical protein